MIGHIRNFPQQDVYDYIHFKLMCLEDRVVISSLQHVRERRNTV